MAALGAIMLLNTSWYIDHRSAVVRLEADVEPGAAVSWRGRAGKKLPYNGYNGGAARQARGRTSGRGSHEGRNFWHLGTEQSIIL